MVKRLDLALLAAIFLLIIGLCRVSFAQRQSGCDSLEFAWRYYSRAEFDMAFPLVANCAEPSALELRAFIAFKARNMSLGDSLICRLLQQAPDYEFDSRRLPVPDFMTRVEGLKEKCFSNASLRAKPLIQPETNVLGWMQCNIGYGGIFGDDDNEAGPEPSYFPILTHMRLGFERAELEFRSIDIKNDIDDLKDQLLILAFRLQIVPEGTFSRGLPGLTFHFRTTVSDILNWNTDPLAFMQYRRSLEQLRIVASKSFKSLQLHAGADIYFSLTNCVYPDTAIFPESYCQEGMPGYRKTSPYAAYALAQWHVGLGTMFSVAWYSVPFYRFNSGQDSQAQGKKSYSESLDMGVRIFPVRWMAIDLMANILFDRINLDPTDPQVDSGNDWRIKAGVIWGFSLAKFIPQPRVF